PAYLKSVSIHISIVIGFFVFQYLPTLSDPLVIPEAIHVDLVGLPDLVKSERQEVDFSAPVKEQPKKEDVTPKIAEKPDIKVPTKEDTLKDAMEAIKQFREEAKKKPKNEVKNSKEDQ